MWQIIVIGYYKLWDHYLNQKCHRFPHPQPLPEPPKAEVSAEEQERIAAEQAALERKRRGRKSTILTSPLGDQTEAETERKLY